MVNFGRTAEIVFVCLFTPAMALGESSVRSVRVVSESPIHVKPCEPVFVLLEVTAPASADRRAIRRIPQELAAHVAVDKRDYDVEFNITGLNPVAAFYVDRWRITDVDDQTKSCPVVAMLFWNYLNATCVFAEAGTHRVEFLSEVYVDVVVEPPTKDEQEVVAEIHRLGLEFVAFVADLQDFKRAEPVMPDVERLLERHPDSVHAGFLSICLGIAKLPAVRHECFGSPEVDATACAEKQVAHAKRYFEPYCQGKIKSVFGAMARYHLGIHVLNRLRHEQDPAREEFTDMRRQAIALLESVKDSPYSLEYASKASTALREMSAPVSLHDLRKGSNRNE